MPIVTSAPLTPRRQVTRDRVLDAASEIFAEQGFTGSSVEDICERAGFSRGAFYSNFSSKDDLVIELSRRHADELVERIRAAASAAANSTGDVLHDVFVALAGDTSRDRWLVLTTEFTLHAIRHPEARRAWAARQREVRAALIAAVDEAIDERGVTLPMSTDVFVRAAIALTNGSTTQRLIEPGSLAVGQLERTVLPVLLGVENE